MAQATGAQGVPLISIVAGAVYYSLDQGATWTEAQQPGSPSNSAAPVSGDGTVATPFTIAAGAVALTKLATQANNTVVGNIAGSSASPVALTATQLTALINPATPSLPGAMTAAQASTLLNAGAGVGIFAHWADVDVTLTGATRITPTIAGFAFVPIRAPVVVLSVTGTATTGLNASIGNNSAAYNNTIAGSTSLPTAASINLGAGAMTSGAPAPTVIGAALPFFVNINVAVTGATACTIRYGLAGYWTPVTF